MKRALVTGSAGLVGSESVAFLVQQGYTVIGVDNDMRRHFFGDEASTDWNRRRLEEQYGKQYVHYGVDIRDQKRIEDIFSTEAFDLIIHTAAQPSHDWAAKEPMTDFTINALGTMILLEAYRAHCPEATFIFTSTNKVYGDGPNFLPLVEHGTRFEVDTSHSFAERGIDESMSIDQQIHSVFGASKVAADVMVQEYGRYFHLPVGVFRGGCLTGPAHSGAELHGFLSFLVKCIATGRPYSIYGYKAKQVRDNIHSTDLVNMFWHFHQAPRSGEVYNVGGSRHANVSMLEAIEKIEAILGKKAVYTYVDTPRIGDHIWYVSDVSKFRSHYPQWEYTYSIDSILEDLCRYGYAR